MTETILFFAGRPGQGAPLPPARHGARRGRRVRRRVLPHEDAARQHPLLLVDQADLQHVALQVQEESQGERSQRRERETATGTLLTKFRFT